VESLNIQNNLKEREKENKAKYTYELLYEKVDRGRLRLGNILKARSLRNTKHILGFFRNSDLRFSDEGSRYFTTQNFTFM
ncbi:9505_t:CDS:2, partial [Entrophospora sp. SA101]